MPRKQDSDTRMHFRAYEDEEHTQKRAWCLHCNQDACADNIQRMKNHLNRCEAYRSSTGNEAVFSIELDGPIAPDAPLQPSLARDPHPQGHVLAPPGANQGLRAPGPSPHHQDPDASAMSMQPVSAPLAPPPTPPSNDATMSTSSAAKPAAKILINLDKVRQAMGRSTRRMESLEAVLKTQVQDGMQNAATHIRAAIRDERDRLFQLSQTLVDQQMRLRETQTSGIEY